MKSVIANQSEFVAIDFETTGSVQGFPVEPWQIGMVRMQGGAVTEVCFDSLLRTGDRPFHPSAPGRHHELKSEIVASPTLPEIWPKLETWWIGVPLVAHNAATEKKHVREAAPMHRPGPWIDTLTLARVAYPSLESHALDAICLQLGLDARVAELCPGRAAHDALYDAIACGLLLEHILGLPGWEAVTLEQLQIMKATAYYQLRKERRK